MPSLPLMLALLMLGAISGKAVASHSADGHKQGFDMGPSNSRSGYSRARFLEHMLGYLFGEQDVSLSIDERLTFQISNTGALLSGELPLEEQLEALLRDRSREPAAPPRHHCAA